MSTVGRVDFAEKTLKLYADNNNYTSYGYYYYNIMLWVNTRLNNLLDLYAATTLRGRNRLYGRLLSFTPPSLRAYVHDIIIDENYLIMFYERNRCLSILWFRARTLQSYLLHSINVLQYYITITLILPQAFLNFVDKINNILELIAVAVGYCII